MTESAATPASAADLLRRTLRVRLRAAGIHLAINVVIFLGTIYLLLAYWYPGFHFTVDGGWQGLRIMAAVDLVLGPTLTLIVFNPLKARKLIVFDLSCIGLSQLGALIWGFYAIHSQHPVAVTFHEGGFYAITAEPLKVEKYDVAELAKLSDRRPPLAYVAPPEREEEEIRMASQGIINKVARHEDPYFFRPFAAHWAQVKPHAVDAAALSKDNEAFAAELPRFLERRGAQAAEFLYFPYEGRYGFCTLAFTPAGELVSALGCQAL